MEPNPSLVFSSLFLATPGFFFTMKGEPIGALISFACSLASIAWHSTKPAYPLLLTIDIILGNTTALLAAHTATRALPYSIIPGTLFVVGGAVLYWYGKMHSCFVWDPDFRRATRWHMYMHFANAILACCLVYLTT